MVSVEKVDKSTLTAKLASAEAFKKAGLDYPYNLPKLAFKIDNRADGTPYVKVTTSQPVNEPFVTMLVELSWSSGKLLREYTFLLDPPDFKAEQPKPEEVQPIEPVLAEPIVAAAPLPVPEPALDVAAPQPEPSPQPVAAEAAPAETAIAAVPIQEEKPAEAAPAQQAVEQAATESSPLETTTLTQDALSKEEAMAEEVPSGAETIAVLRGDTLGKIAAQVKPADVSLERMLAALYRENAGEFDAHNMNRIRAGKILKMPSAEAIAMQPQADAEELIRAQAADWNVYRQKLAAAKAAAAERADKQEAAGKIETVVTDKAETKEPAKEVLKLSKGEAPGDKAVGAGKATTQDKEIAKEEEKIAQAKALKEAQERTAILEKNVKDMQRLAELKKGAAAASAAAPAATVATEAASAPKEAKPKPKPKAQPTPTPVVAEPAMMDQLLGDPLYMAGGAVLLLVLGAGGFMAVRRKGGSKNAPAKKKVEDEGSATGRITAPIVSSPETGDFTRSAESAAPAPAATESEEVDPIGEADLFLTFGRDAQAEEVLKEALGKNPNNIPVKLKLLSIYSSRKDTNAFYTYAREIKESGDASAWEQTAKMGRELEPSNPFYGGDGSAAAPAAGAKPAQAPSVDFDLGFGNTAKTMAPGFGGGNTVVLDTPTESTTIMSAEAMRAAAQATPMDFDITGSNPGVTLIDSSQEVTSTLNMDDLVFDVTSTHPRVPVPPPASVAPAASAAEEMTFTLDFPTDFKKTEAAAPAAPDIGLGEINLNLDSLGAPAAPHADGKSEQWHEAATKLDLAKAYQEMGDVAGAREILEEVLRDGDAEQKDTAQKLMQQL